MKKNCRKLSNATLARLFFRKLWQGYDLAGVSLKRSLRGGLLEGYLELTPIPRMRELDAYTIDELYAEALRRTPFIGPPQKLPDDWNKLTEMQLAHRCLAGLTLWYKLDEKDQNPLVIQKRYVDLFCALMPLPYLPENTSVEQLQNFVIEAGYRYSDIMTTKNMF